MIQVLGSFLDWGRSLACLVLLVIKVLKQQRKLIEEEEKCQLNGLMVCLKRFLRLFCRKSAKEIKRLKIISVDGLYVRCEVKSSSGISTWEFSADFYDYGNLSGSYFIGYKENDDSTIPKVFLEKVARRIREITYNYDVATPLSSMDLNGLNVDEVKQLFYNSGYLSVHTTSKEKGLFKLFSKNGTVSEVSIDGVSEFSKGQIFRSGSFVNIVYLKD